MCKHPLDLLVSLLWGRSSGGGYQTVSKILLLQGRESHVSDPMLQAGITRLDSQKASAVCTQSRPLNVESSYESVTILHASSSVRCAANTPGSGLIGTLHIHG